jgi:hypothetical protein
MIAAISGLDAKKGPGNEGFPPSFIKFCADELKSPFFIFFISHSLPEFLPAKMKVFLFSRLVNEINDLNGVLVSNADC